MALRPRCMLVGALAVPYAAALECGSSIRHEKNWIAFHYSGQLLSRFQKAHNDGGTAFERRKGRPYRRLPPAFGELVMFLTVADGKHRRKLDERFHTGMFVGLVDRMDEVIVLTKGG